LRYSRKKPGESGYRKTLDYLEGSLDLPEHVDKVVNKVVNKHVDIVIWLHDKTGTLQKPDCRAMNPKACPDGHILKDEMGGCVFHMEIDYKSPGPYKRLDIGADYGGSGTLAGD